MRILAINWQDLKNPQAGGAEVHLEEILKRLARAGHRVDLLCSNFPGGSKKDVSGGITVYRHGSRYNFNWVVPMVARKLIRENRYDAVLEDINKIPFYSPVYQKLPTLVVIPHLFADAIFQEINFVLGAYIYFAEKPVTYVYKNNRFMVISDSTAEELNKRGIARENIEVVECGIDKNVYKFDPETPKFDVPTLVYVGRLKKYKTVETVILAMTKIRAEVPKARLVIIGSGDHRESLERLVESSNLKDMVEFKGFIPEVEKVSYLRRAHLSVYPSLKEGWGLSNIEANACGTAVLAARVPGLRDSVDEGRSGLLFEYGNIDDYSEKAVKILQDDDYRRGLEMGGLRWAAQFSWDKAANETERILKGIIESR
ncbi:MAG: glycosyltransferase family 4 protein [candidate division Zixibacteria bacterium]